MADTPENVAQIATRVADIPAMQATLLGIKIEPDTARALIRLPGGRIVTATTGERVDNATLAAIDAEGIILKRGGQATRLTIPGS